MTEKPVNTIAGPFDRKRLKALKEVIQDQDRDSTVMFEGQELLVSFGGYLAEFVEGELGKRNTRGL
ncbi:MAG: hypothetical protein CMG88_03710 [Marinobacter sp.]|nr:hypothetical protein [Marinobacter sp.]MBP53651.1 hypothetical protein [Marinobacter sp.]|tara:strand:- start:174 stop:371 length:198 start_codon:yes stop_codon:yes gene_type:complete